MKTRLCSALAVASLCFASTAFGADSATDPAMDQAQPAPMLDIKQLPAAVQATLEREGRVNKVQEQTDNGAKVYDASVSKDGKNYSVRVDSSGSIVDRKAGEP